MSILGTLLFYLLLLISSVQSARTGSTESEFGPDPPGNSSLLATQHPIAWLKTKKPYERDCAVEECAAGKAWRFTVHYAFTSKALARSNLVEQFELAIKMVTDSISCIEFRALRDHRGSLRAFDESEFKGSSTEAPFEGVILVDSKQSWDCYTLGVGFPGVYGMRYMSLGACTHVVGIVAHELLHALGMNHEQNRMDAIDTYEGYGPYIELKNVKVDELPQYAAEHMTYMGSRAVGGYTIFDFDSIMMYGAAGAFRTLPDGQHDKQTGQRERLSDGDIGQLKDMYGCLEPTGAVCPTTAASRDVDQDGECICPSNTQCFAGLEEGCPSKRGTSSEYFSVSCASCHCKRSRCPSGFSPNDEGDCACPEGTWCVQGESTWCPSSRSSRDVAFFHSSCRRCRCVPRQCNRRSGAISLLPNDEGDCECPRGAECQHSIGGTSAPGCPMTNGGIGLRYFSVACQECSCAWGDHSERNCRRYGTTSNYPDSEGDCMCMTGHTCIKSEYGGECPYSGGLSTLYFSAACTTCQCMELARFGRSNTPFWPYRYLHVAHERCNTKCGAQRAALDPISWNLQGVGLAESTCGECKVLPMTEGRFGMSCQDFDLDPEFELFGSHPRHALCCRKLLCTLEEETCDQRGRTCEENAKCVLTADNTNMFCQCNEGYETTPHKPRADGRKCSPVKPPGSRCCGLRDEHFMWVPKKLLEWKAFKLVCPKRVLGDKWTHAKDDELCETNRFVYAGRGTPAKPW